MCSVYNILPSNSYFDNSSTIELQNGHPNQSEIFPCSTFYPQYSPNVQSIDNCPRYSSSRYQYDPCLSDFDNTDMSAIHVKQLCSSLDYSSGNIKSIYDASQAEIYSTNQVDASYYSQNSVRIFFNSIQPLILQLDQEG